MRLRAVPIVAVLAGCAALFSTGAAAQAVPGGAALGMNAQQLRKAVPALKALRRPVRLAGGLVARWSGPVAAIAGVTLVPTYFFAGGELRRVEYLATNAGASAFAALRHWGRARWGVELATQDPGAASASWSTDDMDIYLQHVSGAQVPRLRLVVKRRALKDASEL